MRLLIVTQKVDREDDLLGFFHQWIIEFAKHCESVTVICLEKGVYELPANVRVLSLGKECCGKLEERTGLAEQGPSLRKFSTAWRLYNRLYYVFNFYKQILHERNNYDSVFVHMNTEYMVLAGWLWRMLGKKVALWHAHFEVNARLLIAGFFAHQIFTTTPDGCRAWKKKVHPIGHGIDIEKFKVQSSKFKVQEDEPIRFLYAGKITPIKNVHVLVDAARILKSSWDKKFVVDIVGPPTDPAYDAKLRAYIAAKGLGDVVTMHGRIAYRDMPAYYQRASAVVNMCPTGAMDKMVLEGIAAGAVPIAANEAFRELFGEYACGLLYPYQCSAVLAEKIKRIFEKEQNELIHMREDLHTRMTIRSKMETRILKVSQFLTAPSIRTWQTLKLFLEDNKLALVILILLIFFGLRWLSKTILSANISEQYFLLIIFIVCVSVLASPYIIFRRFRRFLSDHKTFFTILSLLGLGYTFFVTTIQSNIQIKLSSENIAHSSASIVQSNNNFIQTIYETQRNHDVSLKEANNRNSRLLQRMISDLEYDRKTIFYDDFWVSVYEESWPYIHRNFSQKCKDFYAEITISLNRLNNMNNIRRNRLYDSVALFNQFIKEGEGMLKEASTTLKKFNDNLYGGEDACQLN